MTKVVPIEVRVRIIPSTRIYRKKLYLLERAAELLAMSPFALLNMCEISHEGFVRTPWTGLIKVRGQRIIDIRKEREKLFIPLLDKIA